LALEIGQLEATWKKTKFEFVLHNSTFLIQNFDELHQNLDSDISRLEAMIKNIDAKPFESRIKLWAAKLRMARDDVTEMEKCQNMWRYLETILGS
jgi:hypothetical protein